MWLFFNCAQWICICSFFFLNALQNVQISFLSCRCWKYFMLDREKFIFLRFLWQHDEFVVIFFPHPPHKCILAKSLSCSYSSKVQKEGKKKKSLLLFAIFFFWTENKYTTFSYSFNVRVCVLLCVGKCLYKILLQLKVFFSFPPFHFTHALLYLLCC